MSPIADSLARALSRQRAIATLEELPVRTRLPLMLFDATRKVAPRDLVVDLGPARVELDGERLDIDWYVFRTIFLDREYGADYRDASVLDIGAHKGYFGGYALAQGARNVLSVEPEAANYARLEAAAAKSDSWETLRAAAGDSTGEIELYVDEDSWSHTIVPGVSDSRRTETVKLVSARAPRRRRRLRQTAPVD